MYLYPYLYVYIYICLYCQCPFKKIQVNFRVTRSRKKLLNHQRFTFEFCRIFFVHFILVQLRPVLPQKGCKVFFRTKCEVFLLKACCQIKKYLENHRSSESESNKDRRFNPPCAFGAIFTEPRFPRGPFAVLKLHSGFQNQYHYLLALQFHRLCICASPCGVQKKWHPNTL